MKRTVIQASPTSHSGLFFLLFSVACLFAFTPHVTSADTIQTNTKHILILNSYNPGYKWSDNILEGIRSVLDRETNTEIYIEYMDTKRHDAPEYYTLLQNLYEVRYSDTRFEVIIATDDPALDFLLAHRAALFPETPVVFCGANQFDPARIRDQQNITGVSEAFDFKGTVDLAIGLHPGLRNVVLVADATRTAQINMEWARPMARQYTNQVQFIYLQNLTSEEMQSRLAGLDPRSVILVMSFFRDKTGKNYSLEEGVAFIVSANSQIPVYSFWDSFIQNGVLGGRVVSGFYQGKTAAEMARRILRGESASNIPVVQESPNVYMFDYPQLQRFGLTMEDLPPGAVILHQPFSYYQKYRVWILGISTLVLFETLLIIILFISRSRRIKAETALKESQKQMISLSNNLNAVIYQAVATPQMQIIFTYMSAGIEKLLGILPQDVIHDPAVLFSRVVEEDRPSLIEARQRSVKHSELYDHEMRIRNIKDEVRWLRFCATPRTEKDRVVWDGFIVDVTSQKQAEEERRALDIQIQQTQKLESLGVLAGGIAHDFNNLLMGILGNAELATDEIASSSPSWVNLRDIKTAARRAADLCRQLLAYSGRGRFVIETVDLNHVVEEMAQLLDVSISKNVVLKQSFASSIPKIKADPTQIRQIIMNLITNASEAISTKSGIISISTGAKECDKEYLQNTILHDDLPEGLYAYLEVMDTGSGMSEDVIKRIFDPFFTSKFTGRGLGLAAVLGIVRGHKGAIKVESRAGRGTTFRVLFPALESSQETGTTEEKDAGDAWRGEGLFLLVDDEETIRAVGKRMLQKLGYEVLTAANGKEAVELFKQQP
ncbi:MAG: ABC transporter substrate binding protein, partial [Lentisphaerota bacterium]